MKHAELLQALREPGRTNEQAVEILSAMASSFPAGDEVTEALDACIAQIEYATMSERRVADQGEAWDRKRTAPKLQVFASSEIPGFLKVVVS